MSLSKSDALPLAFQPGSDLMSKIIMRNPQVYRIIIEAMRANANDYIVGNAEWDNGKRSDLILEPKSNTSNPIIVEVQHTVNKKFMKRLIDYSLQAYARFGCDPMILIFAVDSVAPDVLNEKKESDIAGTFCFPSTLWAQQCNVVCEETLHDVESENDPIPPFIALSEFLIGRALSLETANYRNNKTMKLLYTLATQHWQSVSDYQANHLIDNL